MLEIIIFGASLAIYVSPHRELSSLEGDGKYLKGPNAWEGVDIAIDVIRVGLLCLLIGLYVIFALIRASRQRSANRSTNEEASETTGLLNGQTANGHAEQDRYGATNKTPKPKPAGWTRPTTAPSKSWWEYITGYSLFFPYLWPAKSRRLQLVVIFCFTLVMIQRGVNVLVPIQVGVVTNKLSGEDGELTLPWGDICLFIFYKMMQGSTGWLGAVRSTLWIPISQYSYQALSTAAFEHVHGLSLDFHLGKKTGEVLSALSKGNAINTFLEQVTFQVVPMLIDLGVAIAYFLIAFDAYYALVVAIVTFCYLYLTIRMAQWRAEIRRKMVNASRDEDAVK